MVRFATRGFLAALSAAAMFATLTSTACGEPDCVPMACLNDVKYQTCDTCDGGVCTVVAESLKKEQIDTCTYGDSASNPSAKNTCYNQVNSAAESWCVMHAMM